MTATTPLMGYPHPYTAALKQLNANAVTASTQFTRLGRFHFGGRMAIITIPNTKKLIVWSALPVTEEFDRALKFATKDAPNAYDVSFAIIPDKEHTLASVDLKKKFPNAFLIGPSGITDKPELKLDYEFQDKEANTVVPGATVHPDLAGYEFVFLNGHLNREVVMLDKSSKTLFEADLLFNIPKDGKNEDQYPGEHQNKGILSGIFTRNLNPDSGVGGLIHRRLLKPTEDNKKGLAALLTLGFDTVVMCHGCVIETGGKDAFKKLFPGYY